MLHLTRCARHPFGDMPFPVAVQLVNAAAEGFCDESATFMAGAQVSAKIRDWLGLGMALPLTWSVGNANACPVSFSDCVGGALQVVATSGAGSGGRITWSAICIGQNVCQSSQRNHPVVSS